MKVCHICLSNFYADGFLYQENQLVREHVRVGHEVTVIASTVTIGRDGHLNYKQPGQYIGGDGAQVIRLPYRFGLPRTLARKVRAYPGVLSVLSEIAPDAIMFHGSAAWELGTVAKYVKQNPGVVFHIDSHAQATNSAQTLASWYLLHGQFYRRILARAMQVSGPLLCVSISTMDFADEVYRVPRERLEFFPLGGQILPNAEREVLRTSGRARLQLPSHAILMVQAGKQNRSKHLPATLKALARIDDPRIRLVVAGVLKEDVRGECEALMAADPRVTFLGWQTADELTELLCAADLYIQPRTQSVTMQHSLCCGCPVVLDNIPAHQPYIDGNGWLVSGDAELECALREACAADLGAMGARSLALARETLDYRVLARRVLTR